MRYPSRLLSRPRGTTPLRCLPARRTSRVGTAAGLAAWVLASGSGSAQVEGLNAQRFVHERWGVEDGLPVNSINDLLQSRDGYLWAATFDGLVRFDGARFTVFNSSVVSDLPSNRVLKLKEDGEGALWILTEQAHLICYQRGSFTHIRAEHGLPTGVALAIAKDSSGRLWVGSPQGVGIMEGTVWQPVLPSTLTKPVVAIAHGAGGVTWLATSDRRVFRMIGDRLMEARFEGPRPFQIVTQLHVAADGTAWISTDRGAFFVPEDLRARPVLDGRNRFSAYFHGTASSPLGGVVARGSYTVDWVQNGVRRPITRGRAAAGEFATFTDSTGLWFAEGASLYREGQFVYRIGADHPGRPEPPQADSLARLAQDIRALLRDREGSIWFGTFADGLHRIKPALFTVVGEEEGLLNRNVYSVMEDSRGAFWFGTWGGGVSRLDETGITNFPGDDTRPFFVRSVTEDREGNLWLGSFSGGASICDTALRCRKVSIPDVGNKVVSAVYHDRGGGIWIGSSVGLYRSEGTGEWRRFPEEEGAPRSIVRVFLEAQDGVMWMGTNGDGLARYGPAGFLPRLQGDSAVGLLIRSLYQDEEGWLWVGTEGRGLVRFAPDGTLKGAYRAEHGLFDDVIHQILEDDDGRLWMSTNRGIFWVERSELLAFDEGEEPRIHSVVYTERDGLRSREANGGSQPAGVKARDGRLWWPTQDGVVVVDPADVMRNALPPPVVIERTLVRGVAMADQPAVELQPDHRDFQIEYTALSFLAPENVRFRYLLEGYDREWVEAGNRRTAFYTNVPAGEYTFRVLASNNDGVWNEEGAAVSLRVVPRFTETTTYFVLIGLTLLLATAGGFRWRVRRLRKRAEELSALVDLRTKEIRRHEARLQEQNARLESQTSRLADLDRVKSRFYTDISHEFRTPLTLTIGPLEDLRTGLHGPLEDGVRKHISMALRNAKRLLLLINQILETTKLESGEMALRAREHELDGFLQGVVRAFTPVAESRRIRLTTELTSRLRCWIDPDALEKVFTNLLSNAFKYTPDGGTVAVRVERREGPHGTSAAISVADSGPGIPEAEQPHVFERFYQVASQQRRTDPGTGIGLALAKEYVELHGGEIEVANLEGMGAVFTVHLKLGRNHLRSDQIAQTAPEGGVAAANLGYALPALAGVAPAGDQESRPDQDESGDRPTVLVVDDNADVRDYIRSHFQIRYRVVEAADGREALRCARAVLPDLIISDVMMREMDGHELCRRLKESSETDFIPVILLTAQASVEQLVTGLQGGADDYVVKPFQIAVLDARVANLIATRRRLLERLPAPVGPPLQATPIEVLSTDASYLERVKTIIEARMGEETFGVSELAQAIGQDRSHLYRRLRALLNESPTDLIRRLRLERAAQLLAGRAGSVAEIAYAVGFQGVSYFSRCFREQYQVTPSEYREAASVTA